MDKVFFKPWVGRNYQSGGVFNKKVLVLGDSHHCEDEVCSACGDIELGQGCAPFTSNVINYFLDSNNAHENWMKTFTKFERAMMNRALNQNEKHDFWDSIVFYNYIQKAMQGPNAVPNDELFTISQIPFLQIIEAYKPNCIICWGQGRLFNGLPKSGRPGPDLIIDGEKDSNTWIYNLSDGSEVLVYAIKHPARAFSWADWHPFIMKAVELA